jgi:uncharacterized RDD family membrane protein YckC
VTATHTNDPTGRTTSSVARAGTHPELAARQPPMWRRLMARLVDVVAVATWVFALSIAHVFIHLQLWSETVAPAPWGNWFLATITFTLVYALYEIVFISRTGATPGKDLLGIKVVDAATGGVPSLGQAARRWFLPGIVQPIPGAWIGGVATLVWGSTALFDPERRTVHDRLADTRVMSKEPPRDDDERERRRQQFTPRFIDPFAVFRMARSNPAALRNRPDEG